MKIYLHCLKHVWWVWFINSSAESLDNILPHNHEWLKGMQIFMTANLFIYFWLSIQNWFSKNVLDRAKMLDLMDLHVRNIKYIRFNQGVPNPCQKIQVFYQPKSLTARAKEEQKWETMENDCFKTSPCDVKNLEIETLFYLQLVKTNILTNHTIIRLNNKNCKQISKELSKISNIKYKPITWIIIIIIWINDKSNVNYTSD